MVNAESSTEDGREKNTQKQRITVSPKQTVWESIAKKKITNEEEKRGSLFMWVNQTHVQYARRQDKSDKM